MNEEEEQTIEETIMAFQEAFGGVEKARTNTFTQSMYANLDDVWNAIKEHLLNLKLSVIQRLAIADGEQVLITTVKNEHGESVESVMKLMLEKNSWHSMGAALNSIDAL